MRDVIRRVIIGKDTIVTIEGGKRPYIEAELTA